MSISSPPHFPSSFDPALHLHSENPPSEPVDLPSSHSHELEAIEEVREEDRARKTANGIVIQHRAWSLSDAFRSDEDRLIRSPLRGVLDPTVLTSIAFEGVEESQNSYTAILPSSPPIHRPAMPSPVLYPRSPISNADGMFSPRKRRKLEESTSILTECASKGNRLHEEPPKSRGPFICSDDSDSDDEMPEQMDQTPTNQENMIPTFSTYPEKKLFGMFSPRHANPGPHQSEDDYNTFHATDTAPSSSYLIRTSSGHTICLPPRRASLAVSYEQEIASRSTTAPGRAHRSYYGIEIHSLLDELAAEPTFAPTDAVRPSTMPPVSRSSSRPSGKVQLWTEKYRARSFTTLIGDERTHRRVLHWLKSWDPVVFSSSKRSAKQDTLRGREPAELHRKILLLTGPPGLGKTTLAHVCARHAGYEVQEINASDERSANVVKTRIKDMLGTENVRTATAGARIEGASGKVRTATGKPVCVVVDEVDGAAASSGSGGDSGFIKAVLDLVALDQRNSGQPPMSSSSAKKPKSKFRMRRPLILICNDLYATSLRLLRQSSAVEIVHVRPPALGTVATRLDAVFRKEGIAADSDAIRRICETIWSTESKKTARFGQSSGDGDVRSIMVAAEWIGRRWIAECARPDSTFSRLTKQWVESAVIADFAAGGKGARAIGRTSARDVVTKIFAEHAGLSRVEIHHMQSKVQSSASEHTGTSGVSEGVKRAVFERLRHIVEACGEVDRVVSDAFAGYPEQPYQDDYFLSKPTLAHEFLHFHDQISARVHRSHEWELGPYLSLTPLALHDLFSVPASIAGQAGARVPQGPNGPKESNGPQANRHLGDHSEKEFAATLAHFESVLPHPSASSFKNNNLIALELVPYLLRILSPGIKVVGASGSKGSSSSVACVRKASEKAMLALSVNAALATGVTFERVRVENTLDPSQDENGDGTDQSAKISMAQAQSNMGWIYRMQPAIDTLTSFAGLATDREKVSFAVRRLLEEERRREEGNRLRALRNERMGPGKATDTDTAKVAKPVDVIVPTIVEEKDFFGRKIQRPAAPEGEEPAGISGDGTRDVRDNADDHDVWLNYHEGFSRAVKKAVTLDEFLEAFTL